MARPSEEAVKRSPMPPRKAPMRRSGFAKETLTVQVSGDFAVRITAVEFSAKPFRRKATMVSSPMLSQAINPQPKFIYIRDTRIRDACRSIACQNCYTSRPDAGVTWSHANWGFGKGRGIKCSDEKTAALCMRCHTELDSGSKLSEAERKAMWWAAHVNTIKVLVRLGRWPDGVPVPDIEHNPF